MPGSIPFEYAESTYGGASIGISDNPSYPENERSLHARSYWFGCRLLQCWIAEVVFQNTNSSSDGTNLDAEMMGAQKSFPYERCLKTMIDHPLIHIPVDVTQITGDDYTRLATVIGHTIYDGDKEVKKELAAITQSSASFKHEPMVDHWATEIPQRPISLPRPIDVQTPRLPNLGRAGPPGLGSYTSKIEEWKRRARVEIDYQLYPITEYDWECKLTVKGPSVGTKEFKAEGRVGQNKKEARHLASKQACEYFGL